MGETVAHDAAEVEIAGETEEFAADKGAAANAATGVGDESEVVAAVDRPGHAVVAHGGGGVKIGKVKNGGFVDAEAGGGPAVIADGGGRVEAAADAGRDVAEGAVGAGEVKVVAGGVGCVVASHGEAVGAVGAGEVAEAALGGALFGPASNFDFASANSTGSLAEAEVGSNDTASAFGTDSAADADNGSNDMASVFGNTGDALAGFGASNEIAAVFADNLTASAVGVDGLIAIMPAFLVP